MAAEGGVGVGAGGGELVVSEGGLLGDPQLRGVGVPKSDEGGVGVEAREVLAVGVRVVVVGGVPRVHQLALLLVVQLQQPLERRRGHCRRRR